MSNTFKALIAACLLTLPAFGQFHQGVTGVGAGSGATVTTNIDGSVVVSVTGATSATLLNGVVGPLQIIITNVASPFGSNALQIVLSGTNLWLSNSVVNTNGVNAALVSMGTLLTNFANTIGANCTNFSLAIGLNGTNYTYTTASNLAALYAGYSTNYTEGVGANDTNFTQTVGTSITNYVIALGTSVSNLISSSGTAITNYINIVGAACSNLTLSVSNYFGLAGVVTLPQLLGQGANDTNFAISVGTASTNYTLTIGGYGTNYTLTVGGTLTNYVNTVSNALYGIITGAGTNLNGSVISNFVYAVAQQNTNLSLTVATNATNFTLSCGTAITNYIGNQFSTIVATAEAFAQGLGASTTNYASNAVYTASMDATNFATSVGNSNAQSLSLNTYLMTPLLKRIWAGYQNQASNPPVRVLFLGDSMNSPPFDHISSASAIVNDLTGFQQSNPYSWPSFGTWNAGFTPPTGANPPIFSIQTNWWTEPLWGITKSGGSQASCVFFGPFTNVNRVELCWFQTPYGDANFGIVTNNTGGLASLFSTVPGFATSFTTQYTNFALPTGNYYIAMTNTGGAGTNLGYTCTAYNSNVFGFVTFYLAAGSMELTNTTGAWPTMLTCNSNNLRIMATNINPDLVIYHAKDASECGTFGEGMIPSWLKMYQTFGLTNAVWVVVGTEEQSGDWRNGWYQNQLYRAMCATNPIVYVDSYIPPDYYGQWISLDGVHPTQLGANLSAAMIETQLGLRNSGDLVLDAITNAGALGVNDTNFAQQIGTSLTNFALAVSNALVGGAWNGTITTGITNSSSQGITNGGPFTNNGNVYLAAGSEITTYPSPGGNLQIGDGNGGSLTIAMGVTFTSGNNITFSGDGNAPINAGSATGISTFGGAVDLVASAYSGTTNVLTPTATAYSQALSTLASGYTNTTATNNAYYSYNGTSGSAIWYWTAGSGTRSPIQTNTIVASGGGFPLQPNCGVQITSGVGVNAAVVFKP